VKQVLIVGKIFAFLSLLFVPSIVLVLGLGYLARETTSGLFGFIGIAVFMINLAYVGTRNRRVRLWRKLNAIAGLPARD
jgi:cadmium resistance protein CadD (predicted permease)